MENIKKFNSFNRINEDWGSSDQNIMNAAIHKEMGEPTEMPSPFDDKLREIVADNVDFYWDEWEEYKNGGREDLITHAIKSYFRSYFTETFNNFVKMFENFSEDVLKDVADPNKPIVRDDLVGEYAPDRNTPEIEVVYAVEFVPSGRFGAINKAENYLKDMGYTIGSMQGSSPIGFADGSKYQYVSKWGNMSGADRQLLDGAIISKGDFREGESIIVWFKEPKF